MESIFFDAAVPNLERLTSNGADIYIDRTAKTDVVVIQKGPKRIEVVYEAYGPPFCRVRPGDGGWKQIEPGFQFESAARLGGGDKTIQALAAHEAELVSYVKTLLPLIKNELS